jgi:hypothetical protein
LDGICNVIEETAGELEDPLDEDEDESEDEA